MASNTISIDGNIEKFTNSIKLLNEQKMNIDREILKAEGALMVLSSFKDVGVTEIPYTNPLETKEVIDSRDS